MDVLLKSLVLLLALCACGAIQSESAISGNGLSDLSGDGCAEHAHDPGFWCTTFSNAQKCHKFDHCLHSVWVNETTGPAVDAQASLGALLRESVAKTMAQGDCYCQVCKYVVQLYESFLKLNWTQALIESYFDKLCQNVPESIRPMCTKTVEKHFMVLVNMLGKVDPQKACVFQCNEARPADAKLNDHVNAPAPPNETCLCQTCQTAVKVVDAELTIPAFRSGMVEYVVKYCGYVSPTTASIKCADDARAYIPELLDMLSNMDPIRTCNRFYLCKNSTVQVRRSYSLK